VPTGPTFVVFALALILFPAACGLLAVCVDTGLGFLLMPGYLFLWVLIQMCDIVIWRSLMK
jgi:hypothetical protein